MFSAYWLSIFEINLPKTVESTSENKNGFLAKDAAIVLTGSARCVAVNLLAKRNGTKRVTLSNLHLFLKIVCYISRDSDQWINYSIERASE